METTAAKLSILRFDEAVKEEYVEDAEDERGVAACASGTTGPKPSPAHSANQLHATHTHAHATVKGVG